MFEKFKDYMFFLLHAPLKILQEKSEIYKLFNVIGNEFDRLKNNALNVEKQSNIFSSTGEFLELLANDRNIIRYQNETDEDLRRRIMLKPDVMKIAGTKKEIILALKSLNFEANVEPCYLTDKSKWAEFYIIINDSLIKKMNYNFKIIKETVMEVKQASSKPNWVFRYDLHNNIENKIIYKLDLIYNINFWGSNYDKAFNDGNLVFNGNFLNNGYKGVNTKSTLKKLNLDIGIKIINSIENSVKIETRADYFNDGIYTFDGTITNNSGKEVIEIGN